MISTTGRRRPGPPPGRGEVLAAPLFTNLLLSPLIAATSIR